MPSIVFIGCYIQPENSNYFDPDMFSELGSFLITLREKKLIPFMGGDLNCRFGDLNMLFEDKLYTGNVDASSNKHGRTYGRDICTMGGIFPLNHLTHRGNVFEGDFTYFKGEKKSQIDFVFTCNEGLKIVKSFSIIKDNWHLSDHRPVSVEISAARMVNSAFVLRRAKELNYEYQPNRPSIVRHLGSYDLNLFSNYLLENDNTIQADVLQEIQKNNISGAIAKFDIHLHEAHRVSKKKKRAADEVSKVHMEKANSEFDNYKLSLIGQSADDPEAAYRKYQAARNCITSDMYSKEHRKWKNLLKNDNPKALWQHIDWKGNLSKSEIVRPTNDELALHFEKLYSCSDQEESAKIEQLSTDTYIPALDDPITMNNVNAAMKEMKKGGYDYSIEILKVLVSTVSPLLLLFFNIMFYVAYPVSLAKSLLSALPKKGNLSLPVNYRGIQMLAALSALYDRIMSIRLRDWCGVHYLQSAFQKGKSTIHQIFTIRLLIHIAKRTNTTIYIGFFDLEKAFDKVSRLLLLKRLIKRGIGNCMLQALKRVYLHTTCIIGTGSNASDEFRTFSGIRQGAPSSVLLFIFFIDELITCLHEQCDEEPILRFMHCLLHADDTAVLSTDRELFKKKCNHMLKFFNDNSLSLNFPKSSYLIINGKEHDIKCDLELDFGMLEYKSVYEYLGAIISDCGNITSDIERYINGKRANVTIKFNNFLRKNFLAPLSEKLNVLDVCVSSSLTYGCETWGTASIKSIEIIYRHGLKRALSVRQTTNNEIVYIETGRLPLSIRMAKQQLKFWNSIQVYMADNPDHPLASLIEFGQQINLPYLQYYEKLEADYNDSTTCKKSLTQAIRQDIETKIRSKGGEDDGSRFGVYMLVNPSLASPEQHHDILESERVITSRYRCGSHNLKIESGRLCNPKIPRDDRLCMCNNGIQSLHHCLFECPLLHDLYGRYPYASIEEAFALPNIADLLLEVEKMLNVT